MHSKRELFIFNIVITFFFILLFRELFEECLVSVYGFMGYRIENNSSTAIWITNVLIVIPILFYSALPRISDVFAIVCYVMIYVPTLIGLQYYYSDYSFVIAYQIAYMIGMILFFLAGRNRVSHGLFKKDFGRISKSLYVVGGCVLMLLFIAAFHGNMRLVSFSNVYDLRSESSEVQSPIPFMGYFSMWMANAFSPLLIALGLEKKNNKYIVLGFLMSLVYYMATGMKASVFIPILSFVFFKTFRESPSQKMKYMYPVLISGLILVYIVFRFFYGESTKMLVGLLMMRTYGIATLETPMYIDVFQSYPYTYYCHVGIINKIFGLYPFDNPSIGHAISEAYGGYDTESNANANFMVTDGIAAGGIIGIIIISIFAYFLFSYLNKLSNNYKFNFILATLTGIIIGFTNMSIFTTIISAGLFILMFFFRYTRIQKKDYK